MKRPTSVNVEKDEDKYEISKAPALEKWQEQVLLYADRVPVVSSMTTWYEANAARVRYYLADEKTGEQIDDNSEQQQIIDILNARAEELGRGVGLRFLIGESRQTFDPETLQLEVRGAGELYAQGDVYKLRGRDGKVQDLGGHYDVWRSYRPDRKWPNYATSSHKALRDVLEAMVIAYAEERAISIRLAMNTGVVVVSGSFFEMEDSDAVNSEGSDPGAAFEKRLQDMLSMAIDNPRNAANFVTPVLVAEAEIPDVSKLIAHVPLAAERDKRKIQERFEMLKNEYASGVYAPSDQVLGFFTDMNHWNGDIVTEQGWVNYLGPETFAEANDAFVEIGMSLNIPTAGFIAGLDNSELIMQKDKSDTALQALEAGAISDAAYRRYAGFTEEDAPEVSDEVATEPTDEEPVPDEGVSDDQSDGITAAAATEGPNLKKMNKSLRKARLNFERQLRDIVMESASEFVRDEDVITAAADDYPDPIDRVAAKLTAAIKAGQKDLSLAAARALSTKRAKKWYARHEARLNTQAERAGQSGARLVKGYLTTRQVTSIPGRDAYGLARSVESEAAGGQASMHPNGDPTQARPLTIMEDDDFVTMIDEEGSAQAVYSWEHGSPPNPFGPHADLDGETWTSDDEREVLDNPDEYPPSAIYHPGDHDGCTCRYDIEFERYE